jgi:hypothetical protein
MQVPCRQVPPGQHGVRENPHVWQILPLGTSMQVRPPAQCAPQQGSFLAPHGSQVALLRQTRPPAQAPAWQQGWEASPQADGGGASAQMPP